MVDAKRGLMWLDDLHPAEIEAMWSDDDDWVVYLPSVGLELI